MVEREVVVPEATASDPLWDRWLKFRDPVLEAKFVSSWRNWICGMDFIMTMHSMAKVFVLIALFWNDGQNESLYDYVFFFLIFGWFSIQSYSKTKFYQYNRTVLITLYRIVGWLGVTYYLPRFGPAQGTICGVLFRMVLKSPVLQIASLNLGMPLRFRDNLLANVLYFFLSIVWTTPAACRFWFSSKDVCDIVHDIEKAVDYVMRFFSYFGIYTHRAPFSTPEEACRVGSCWRTFVFFQGALGLVIPSAAICVGEVYIRLEFLKKMNRIEPCAKRETLYNTTLMICWVSAIIIVSLWGGLGVPASLMGTGCDHGASKV